MSGALKERIRPGVDRALPEGATGSNTLGLGAVCKRLFERRLNHSAGDSPQCGKHGESCGGCALGCERAEQCLLKGEGEGALVNREGGRSVRADGWIGIAERVREWDLSGLCRDAGEQPTSGAAVTGIRRLKREEERGCVPTVGGEDEILARSGVCVGAFVGLALLDRARRTLCRRLATTCGEHQCERK